MTGTTTFRLLMNDLLDGKEEAAATIVEQYTDDLVAVARNRLGPKLRQRVDPEDVLQSVYRSFFGRLREKKFKLGDGRDIWNLLVRMTLNKVCNQANHHRAQRRNMNKEQAAPADSTAIPMENLARSAVPSPEEAMQLVETVQTVVESLKPDQRIIFELRLQGHNTLEIAKQTDRAERSVRRVLQEVRELLTRMAVS